MADYAYFYNSQNGDRLYNAESFEKWLKKFFTTGVFTGDLFVTESTGMKTNVSGGYCNINGKVKMFDATELTHENANATYNRYDLIVAERNDTERDFFLKVVTGGLASQPVYPQLVRSGGIYQIALAAVYIPKGSTEIKQANITDLRSNQELCGIVAGTVEEMDFGQFTAQFEAYYAQFKETNEDDFTEWFEHIKGQLSEDVAGHLQNEIDDLSDKVDEVEKEILEVVSDEYSNEKVYKAGEYCIFDNKLWKKIGAQETGIEPTEGTSWTLVNVGNELNSLSGNLAQMELISFPTLLTESKTIASKAELSISYQTDIPTTKNFSVVGITKTGHKEMLPRYFYSQKNGSYWNIVIGLTNTSSGNITLSTTSVGCIGMVLPIVKG